MLIISDPNVLNKKTARNLLLTTYIKKIPVISYSDGYVKAGALAALYSTPDQIGRQTAEALIQILKTGGWKLRKPTHPSEFSIAVNKKVAQSLDVTTINKSQLHQRVIELSNMQP